MERKTFAVIEIKSIDEEQRTVKGIATTPTVDRMGDTIDPMGATFADSIPLHLYHDSTRPVGQARLGKPTRKGIPFEANIPSVHEPGTIKDRVDEAWQSLKYKLIGAVSIGFNPVWDAIEQLKDGGLKFLKSEILELSLVSIPANPDAVITGIKSLDQHIRAASGRSRPGVSGRKGSTPMNTLQQKLADFKQARTTKMARMNEITEAVQAESREFTEDEIGEFDMLEMEIKQLDKDIRLVTSEIMSASTARPIEGQGQRQASYSRGPDIHRGAKDVDDKFPGQSFTKLVIARALAHLQGNGITPSAIAKHRWGKTNPTVVEILRANEVAGGGSGSGEWGAELVAADGRFTGDFIEFLNGMTVFNRLPLTEVPANVTIKGQDGAATGYWVGESKAIPASASDYSTVSLTPLKVAAISVVSNELLRDSTPAAEMLVRNALVAAIAKRIDDTVFSTTAASSGVSPAGLLKGISGFSSSGTDSDAVRTDIMTLYTPFLTAKNASGLQLVMNPAMAKAISLLTDSLGTTPFSGLNASGGMLLGDPVVTGDNITATHLILLKPSDIYRIGDMGIQVSVSRDASIEMNSVPLGDSQNPTASSVDLVSMYQTESTAFKVVRPLNVAKRRSSAVTFIDDANFAPSISTT